MKKWEAYRYVLLLLIGGIIYCFMTDLPQELFHRNQTVSETVFENVESEEAESEKTVSKNEVSENKIADQEQNSVSQNETQFNKEQQNENILEDDIESDTEANETEEEESVSQNAIATFQTVEDDYFDDAVFIGDSRIVSLYCYSGWEKADFFCSSGMRLDSVFGEPDHRFKDGNWKENIYEALKRKQYGKIYIMLGINDMGVGNLEHFQNLYQDVVTKLREVQPSAIIYIQGIMKVTSARSMQGDYITNEAISVRNQYLETLDNHRDIIYLDVNSVVCDSTGGLQSEYSFDGVHLYAKYIPIWTTYLKEHAITSSAFMER